MFHSKNDNLMNLSSVSLARDLHTDIQTHAPQGIPQKNLLLFMIRFSLMGLLAKNAKGAAAVSSFASISSGASISFSDPFTHWNTLSKTKHIMRIVLSFHLLQSAKVHAIIRLGPVLNLQIGKINIIPFNKGT